MTFKNVSIGRGVFYFNLKGGNRQNLYDQMDYYIGDENFTTFFPRACVGYSMKTYHILADN
jgi:hypothetical protein